MAKEALMSFISELEKDNDSARKREAYKESVDYKLRKIKSVKMEATELCLDNLIGKIYKNAVPMDDTTKDVLGVDLDKEMIDFIQAKQPKGTTYYVKEAIKNGSLPAKHMLEAVESMLTDLFREKALNIKETPEEEIKFDINDPETQDKLEEISSTMQFDELSDVIRNNVKIAANEEINRVKEERQKVKELEEELKNNEDVTTESAVTLEMQKRKMIDPRQTLYQPKLFEGIMVNKLTLIKESGIDMEPETAHQLSFIESTKEMTKLFVLKSLMLESFNQKDVKDLARRYANMTEKGDIDMLREDRIAMFESVMEDYEDGEVTLEGANMDAFHIFYGDFKKKYKELNKKMKKANIDEDFKTSIKCANEMKKLVNDTYTKISKLPDRNSIGSALMAFFFTGNIPFLFRDILAALMSIPTFGIASMVSSIAKLCERINVVIKDLSKRNFDVEDVNLFLNAIKARLKEYEMFINKYIERIKEAEKYSKQQKKNG